MAEQPNPEQLAPGEEAFAEPIDTPYVGWKPGVHIGYPLNQSFAQAVDFSRA